MATTSSNLPLTKKIWIYWQQGWDRAPDLIQASLRSWQVCNPGWQLNVLDQQSIPQVFGTKVPANLGRADIPIEAYSDILRVELLTQFGGVWVDATTICAQPLDTWLAPHAAERAFFAFDSPGPDRAIATWFLYASPGSYCITALHATVQDYWRDRQERDDYFWLHKLFGHLLETDDVFTHLWQAAPHISARHRLHFGPEDPRLLAPPTQDDFDALASGQWPVIKLTRKMSQVSPKGALMERLCQYQPESLRCK